MSIKFCFGHGQPGRIWVNLYYYGPLQEASIVGEVRNSNRGLFNVSISSEWFVHKNFESLFRPAQAMKGIVAALEPIGGQLRSIMEPNYSVKGPLQSSFIAHTARTASPSWMVLSAVIRPVGQFRCARYL
jgi:hypothetical protein